MCVCVRSACSPPILTGVLGSVCLCGRSACTPPILAGVRGVCVLVWILAFHPTNPGWGVRACVFVCARCLYPANPGWGSWCVCLSSVFGFHAAYPGWGVGVPVFVCALCLYPASLGWRVRCGCVCVGSVSGCGPPFLAGVLGCMCLCARSACIPPLLVGVCGVWLGCCPAPSPVPWFVACCPCFPDWRHLVALVAWHLSVCSGCGQRHASLARRVPTRAAPPLVRFGRSRCSRRLSQRRGACPHPGGLGSRIYWEPAQGIGGRPITGLLVPAVGPCRGSSAGLPPRRTRSGPHAGFVPCGSLRRWSSAACAAVVWRVWLAPGFLYRLSFDGGLGRCTGAVSFGRWHIPFRVGVSLGYSNTQFLSLLAHGLQARTRNQCN